MRLKNAYDSLTFIRYKDQLVLIDWKTAEKEKNRVKDLYDNPLQVLF